MAASKEDNAQFHEYLTRELTRLVGEIVGLNDQGLKSDGYIYCIKIVYDNAEDMPDGFPQQDSFLLKIGFTEQEDISKRVRELRSEIIKKYKGRRTELVFLLKKKESPDLKIEKEEKDVREATGIGIDADLARKWNLPNHTEWVITTREFIQTIEKQLEEIKACNKKLDKLVGGRKLASKTEKPGTSGGKGSLKIGDFVSAKTDDAESDQKEARVLRTAPPGNPGGKLTVELMGEVKKVRVERSKFVHQKGKEELKIGDFVSVKTSDAESGQKKARVLRTAPPGNPQGKFTVELMDEVVELEVERSKLVLQKVPFHTHWVTTAAFNKLSFFDASTDGSSPRQQVADYALKENTVTLEGSGKQSILKLSQSAGETASPAASYQTPSSPFGSEEFIKGVEGLNLESDTQPTPKQSPPTPKRELNFED